MISVKNDIIISLGHTFTLKKKKYHVNELITKFGSRKPTTMDVSDFDGLMDENSWFGEDEHVTMKQINEHIERIKNTDLKYPIFALASGHILDGWHRLFKTKVIGETKIDVIIIMYDDIDKMKEVK